MKLHADACPSSYMSHCHAHRPGQPIWSTMPWSTFHTCHLRINVPVASRLLATEAARSAILTSRISGSFRMLTALQEGNAGQAPGPGRGHRL